MQYSQSGSFYNSEPSLWKSNIDWKKLFTSLIVNNADHLSFNSYTPDSFSTISSLCSEKVLAILSFITARLFCFFTSFKNESL